MCGLVGVVTSRGRAVSVDDVALGRMRDALAHRGPDGAGLWRRGHVALAHRRLAVIDPSPAGAQPFVSEDARYALVYNGELYNDHEIREDLRRQGVAFSTASDTETVLRALIAWGTLGIARLRGMYALAFVDLVGGRLVLARDPLGIKPLVYTRRSAGEGMELVFASEAQAILAHPDITPRADIAAVSAYLTTIRTTIGTRTLFEGISTVRAGEIIEVDLIAEDLPATSSIVPLAPESELSGDAALVVRAAVRASVHAHLRSDVPLCTLLSGGLDSTIITATARESLPDVTTYCAGAPGDDPDSDLTHARAVAAGLGLRHVEAPVTQDLFESRWPEMVTRLGMPLSTPNEVAINEVARRLRADGMVVALSGEGADELFGGYLAPLAQAAAFERVAIDAGRRLTPPDRGTFQIMSNAWILPSQKAAWLRPEVWRSLEGDAALFESATSEFEVIEAEVRTRSTSEPALDAALQRHVRYQRRINLVGLLARLDTAMMLEGVEGRTPLADRVVAALAESLPMPEKFRVPMEGGRAADFTKLVLRRGFADVVPRAVLERPKASFPLPFQQWMDRAAAEIPASGLLRELFLPEVLGALSTGTSQHWMAAWPIVNLSLWGRRWWG